MTPEPLRIAALTYAGYAARLLPDCLVGPTLESDAEDAAWERGRAGLLPDSAEYERGRQSVLAVLDAHIAAEQAKQFPYMSRDWWAQIGIHASLKALRDAILRACGDAAAGE